MKIVVLLRHARAERDAPDGSDIARALTAGGRAAAGTMGRFLSQAGQAPALAITSPAVRATETLRLATEAGGWGCEILTDARLYDAAPGDVFTVLGDVDDAMERILLVGHEPTWSTVIRMLVGGGNLAVPTATAAAIELAVSSWSTVGPNTGRLAFLVPPNVLSP